MNIRVHDTRSKHEAFTNLLVENLILAATASGKRTNPIGTLM